MKRHKAAFAVCSICLRVRRGGEWVEATDVIREIRSYEFAVPPGLDPGVCDLCAEPILRRRAEAQQVRKPLRIEREAHHLHVVERAGESAETRI
jgi:NMD protein affecting ribosome stability and mRNA decay